MSTKSTHSPQNLYSMQDKDIKFSLFKSAKATSKLKNISLSEYLDLISDPARKEAAERLRALPAVEYKSAKALQSCITGSGTSGSGRTLEIKNGLAVVDFDQLPEGYANWQELKEVLQNDPFTFIVHFSLSGRGLCVFVKVPKENNFKETFLSLREYYDFKFNVEIDFLADESRLRFISYDADPFYSPDSQIYKGILKETLPEATPQSEDNLSCFANDPASAFNISGLAGLGVVNGLFEALGYSINTCKAPALYEYQRANGSPKSIVAFYNADIVKFQVFSPNTGLSKEHYNLYGLYKELNAFDDYAAQRALAGLGFGVFNESNKNRFPVEALPELFRDYAVDLSTTVNFPIDYTATALLTAVSTAAGSNFNVMVKAGWIEYGSLFTCLIGNAGANKTHPINTVFAPIKARDMERHNQFKHTYELYSSYEKLSKKDKETADFIFAPVLEKSVLSNFTTEILFKRLSENPRGCTVLSDELISFLEGMNNYSKSDQIGFYLSAWSNQSTTVDRVGQSIPLFISKPYLSIIGGLQPRALNKAFPIDKLNNGFYQRFLFAYPDDASKQPLNDNVADEQLADEYANFINKLFEIDEPKTLMFSPAAKRYFYEWQANNCDRVNVNQNSIKGEILSKFDNHFIRLALIVQIMTDPQSTEIGIEAVEAAKVLCDYYLNCSFKVLAKIQNTGNYLFSLPQDKQQLFNELDGHFTTAEAMELGTDLGMAERSIKRFLQDAQLFKKLKHGEYQKHKVP